MRTDLFRLASGALLGSLMIGSLSCSASQSKPSVSLRPDVGEVPADLRSDFESFSTNCSKCHDLERALAAPVTDHRHWDIYVAKMMRTAGSAINEKEAPHILRFLYWYTDRKTGRIQDTATKASETTPAQVPENVPSNKEQPSTSAPAAPPSQAVTTEIEGESNP